MGGVRRHRVITTSMMLTSRNDSSAMMLNAVTEVLGDELVAEVVIPTLSWQVAGWRHQETR